MLFSRGVETDVEAAFSTPPSYPPPCLPPLPHGPLSAL